MTIAVEERDRSTYIGSGDAAAVVGLSRWDSPVGVWSRKVGIAIEERPPSLRMWLGQRLEPILLELYEARTGRKPRRVPFAEAKGIPYIGAHPDYFQLEVKTARSDKGWGDDGAVVTEDNPEVIPIDYYLQVQHQLFCTGWPRSDVAVLIGHDEFRTYTVERAPTHIDALVAAEVELWEHNVIPNVPPPMDDSDAAKNYLRQRFATVREPLRVATPEEAPLLADAVAARAMRDAAVKDFEVVTNRLKAAIGDAAGLTDGRIKATWSPYEKAAYTVRAQSGRTLRLTTPKDEED